MKHTSLITLMSKIIDFLRASFKTISTLNISESEQQKASLLERDLWKYVCLIFNIFDQLNHAQCPLREMLLLFPLANEKIEILGSLPSSTP